MATDNAKGDSSDVHSWGKQLFVGQVPPEWTEEILRNHLAVALGIEMSEMKIDGISTPNVRQKKHAFIRVKDKAIRSKLLSRETCRQIGIRLNIKESDQEEYKRKLFFGRLSDNITKEKVIKMIEIIRSDARDFIEEDFPQIPNKTAGKSRTAFVLFRTHLMAKEIRDSFKRLIGPSGKNSSKILTQNEQNFLEDCCQNKNLWELIRAIDYHEKGKRKVGNRTEKSSNKPPNSIKIIWNSSNQDESCAERYEIKLDLHESDYCNCVHKIGKYSKIQMKLVDPTSQSTSDGRISNPEGIERHYSDRSAVRREQTVERDSRPRTSSSAMENREYMLEFDTLRQSTSSKSESRLLLKS